MTCFAEDILDDAGMCSGYSSQNFLRCASQDTSVFMCTHKIALFETPQVYSFTKAPGGRLL